VSETSCVSRRAPSLTMFSKAVTGLRRLEPSLAAESGASIAAAPGQAENFLARKACQYLGSRVWCVRHG
jgi:hypothetical protein